MTLAKPPAEWQQQAACIGIDVEAFYATPYDRGDDANAAKAVCRKCPVQLDCLEAALESRDDWAILGGTTPAERRAMRRERRTA